MDGTVGCMEGWGERVHARMVQYSALKSGGRMHEWMVQYDTWKDGMRGCMQGWYSMMH